MLATRWARADAFGAAIALHGPSLCALVLPVPLAPARLRAGGYNQAWELARRVARTLTIAAEPMLLLRIGETVHQLASPARSRSSRAGAASPPAATSRSSTT